MRLPWTNTRFAAGATKAPVKTATIIAVCAAVLAAGPSSSLAQGPAVDEYNLDIPAATGDEEGNASNAGGNGGGADEPAATPDPDGSTSAPPVTSTPPSTPTPAEPTPVAEEPRLTPAERAAQKLETYQPTRGPEADMTPAQTSGRVGPALPADVAGQFPVILLIGGLALLAALAVFAARRYSLSRLSSDPPA